MPPRDYTTTPTLDPIEDISRRRILTAIPAIGLMAAGLACGNGDHDEDAEAGTGVAQGAFPVTVEHKHGQTVIERKPERVVSVGYQERDAIVALGVMPLGLRFWNQEYNTIPWAAGMLGDFTPQEIGREGDLDFEAIAALQPDVILGVTAYMTSDEYETLSAIAPTVADHAGYPDGGAPWREQVRLIGTVLGLDSEAGRVILEVESRFNRARAAHPEFEGKTAGVFWAAPDGSFGGYSSQDLRAQVLTEIGFTIPGKYDQLAGGESYFTASVEQLGEITDSDVVIWVAREQSHFDAIRSLPIRKSTDAYAEGREIFIGDLLATALTYASPLSIPYALDHLAPELTAALDGDPSTSGPSTDQEEG